MRVIDLPPEGGQAFEAWLHCMEPWSPEAQDGAARRRAWYERVRHEGLRVKVAVDDDGEFVGQIQALPVERTHVEGEGLWMVLCVWVHGHAQGVGKRQGRGTGNALLAALETDARAAGATGLAAWGLAIPVWMKASWYRRHGFRRADRQGIAELVWKPFSDAARPPRWMPRGPAPPPLDTRPTMSVFCSGWCTAMNATCERALRAARSFGDEVAIREVDTVNPATAREWGMVDAVWVDGVEVRTGPPPAEEAIRKRIERRVRGPWWRRWARA